LSVGELAAGADGGGAGAAGVAGGGGGGGGGGAGAGAAAGAARGVSPFDLHNENDGTREQISVLAATIANN
jgi:hypothetical protein